MTESIDEDQCYMFLREGDGGKTIGTGEKRREYLPAVKALVVL